MRPFKKLSFFRTVMLFAIFVFIGCSLILGGCDSGGGGGGDNNSNDNVVDDNVVDDNGNGEPAPQAALQDRKVYINQDDTMLYSYTADTDEQFTYYGRRDIDGIPTLITMLEYVDTEGESFLIFYDSMGLPAKIIDEQGMTLEFDYNLEDAPLTITAAGGDISLNPLQLITSIGITATVRDTEASAPTQVSTIIPLDETVLVAPDPAIADRFGEEPFGNIGINVEKCGKPVYPGGEVWVNFRWNTTSENVFQYPAFPSSQPGRYLCRIPERTKDPVPKMAETVCSAMADRLSEVCRVFNPAFTGANALVLSDASFQATFCAGVGLVVSAAATPVGGAVAGSACVTLLRGGTITCNTLGRSRYDNPEDPNVAQALCGQVDDALESVNSAIGIDTFVVQAVADFSNSHAPALSVPDGDSWVFTSSEQEVSAYGNYPDLYISASDPAISKVTTSPGAPQKGQEYTVTAEFSCVFGMDLIISVTRDGKPVAYKKRFGDKSDKNVSVDVPKNPTGKSDFIVVSAADPLSLDPPLRKEITINLDEAPVNEAFEVATDIPGVNVSFRPTTQAAIKSLWLTEQEAISLIASEGSSQNSEYISITINPNVVNGTGNYRFSPDITATIAMFLFSSPALTHANVGPYAGTNVQFTAHNGYLEFESWGSNLGDIISGSFAVQVSGVQITGTDSKGSYTSRTHTGAIIGSFNLELVPTDTN